MKTDPLDTATINTIARPNVNGPGSGKAAWVAYALQVEQANRNLWDALDEQKAAIRDHKAEIELLRVQIAERKPTGGRPRLNDARVSEIERDLANGYSQRQAAARAGVSAMTVTRIAKRMADREGATIE